MYSGSQPSLNPNPALRARQSINYLLSGQRPRRNRSQPRGSALLCRGRLSRLMHTFVSNEDELAAIELDRQIVRLTLTQDSTVEGYLNGIPV